MHIRIFLCVWLCFCVCSPTMAESATTDKSSNVCELNQPVRFAGLDWDSNAVITEITRFVMEKAYGCETTVIPGSSIPLLTGLARGSLDVMMEVWKENISVAWKKFEKANRVKTLGVVFSGAKQAFYVPRYMIEGDPKRNIKATAPKLKHVKDLAAYKDLFKDPESPNKGRFHNCILGWSCEIVNTNKIIAYGLDKSFVNFRPGTQAALFASVVSSYKQGKPFVSYLWEPHYLMADLDLIQLEEDPYDPKVWPNLTQKNPSKALVGVAYPDLDIYIGIHKSFEKKAPQLSLFLSKVQFPIKVINKLLSRLVDKKITHKQLAYDFFENHKEIWKNWVSDDKRLLIEAHLKKRSI